VAIQHTRPLAGAPPTLRERFWRWLGFTEPIGPEMPDEMEGYAAGYLMHEVTIVLDWKDRLRALISGTARIRIKAFTDVRISRSWSRAEMRFLPPSRRHDAHRRNRYDY
jgi:hypothetical protein